MHCIRQAVVRWVAGIGLSAVVICPPALALETNKDQEVIPTIAFGEIGQKKAEADSIRLIGHAACAVVEPSCDLRHPCGPPEDPLRGRPRAVVWRRVHRLRHRTHGLLHLRFLPALL